LNQETVVQLSPIAPIGTAVITVLIGLSGFTLRRSLLSKLFAIDVAATGVVTLFILVASRTGVASPIVVDAQFVDSYIADPFPQGVILTAIVIGFSVEALALVLLRHMAREHPLLRVDDFDNEVVEPWP
tara:strand:+ start:412 stop:798 length:387 start_codon:yes stop_codon:yes gene_type:complete